MKASIIIPTYNGARKILHLLELLKRQSISNIEVIVVIDGSTDETENLLVAYAEAFNDFVIVKQANAGRSVARNNGARHATSDLLVFYDDDMLPEVESIRKHCDFHMGTIGLVCGDPVEIEDKLKTDIQNYKASLSRSWTCTYGDGMTQMNQEILFFTASNCSIKRSLFWQLKGFDEKLTDAEDYDLAWRALKAGMPVFYDKGNKAIHNETITFRSYITRSRQYAAAHKVLKAKGIERIQDLRPSRFKRAICEVFAFALWVRLIDRGFFIPLLPRGFRYRLYSTVLYALTRVRPGIQI